MLMNIRRGPHQNVAMIMKTTLDIKEKGIFEGFRLSIRRQVSDLGRKFDDFRIINISDNFSTDLSKQIAAGLYMCAF